MIGLASAILIIACARSPGISLVNDASTVIRSSLLLKACSLSDAGDNIAGIRVWVTD